VHWDLWACMINGWVRDRDMLIYAPRELVLMYVSTVFETLTACFRDAEVLGLE
jgi:hypothetical protein